MQTDNAFQRQVSAAIIQLRIHAPFFATLVLFARILPDQQIATAATDGRDIFINQKFWSRLSSAEQRGLLAHEVLHAALLHVPRVGKRDRFLWNVAADIVVNGMILAQQGFALPRGHLRNQKLEHLSVEEVYHHLITHSSLEELLTLLSAVLYATGNNIRPGSRDELETYWKQRLGDLLDAHNAQNPASDRVTLEQHWQRAMQEACTLAEIFGQGTLPAGLQRELTHIRPAQLDWRGHLWRFLVRTPNDFQGFDRRFIGQGLYLDSLEGEKLRVFVAVDTSGSINSALLAQFLGEVQAIQNAYPHMEVLLYYIDAACHGPYMLNADTALPRPTGGGGTDFRPFFSAVERENDNTQEGVCVYLTDGFGTFPEQAPALPILWVLTPGGLATDRVPFGETVRLIPEH